MFGAIVLLLLIIWGLFAPSAAISVQFLLVGGFEGLRFSAAMRGSVAFTEIR